jgi:hypothetical protein
MLSSLIPIIYLTCAATCFYVALNVGFRLRWLCMPFLFFFASLSVLGTHHIAWPQGLSDLWSLSMVMWTIHVVSVLFCEDPLEVLKRTDIQATSGSSQSTTREAPGETARIRNNPAWELDVAAGVDLSLVRVYCRNICSLCTNEI